MVLVTKNMTAAADVVDCFIFIADQRYRVVQIEEVHTTKETGGALVALFRRCQGTEAPSAGDAIGGGTSLNLAATDETVQTGILSGTEANLTLEDGDRLALDFTGTPTDVAGVHFTALLIPVRDTRRWISEM
jgi:hypothetical protein